MKHPGVRGVNPVPVTRYNAPVAGTQKYLLDWTGSVVTARTSRVRELGTWAYWAALWLLAIGFAFGVLGWPAAAVTGAAAAFYTGRSIIWARVVEVAAQRWGQGDMEGAREQRGISRDWTGWMLAATNHVGDLVTLGRTAEAREELARLPAAPRCAAWAHDVRGDAEMASHLLAEAVPLLENLPTQRLYPPLHAWMQQARGRLLPAGHPSS